MLLRAVAGLRQDDTDDVAVQVCVYCRQPCDADVFGPQAVWTCAWCRANAHVSCYQSFHKDAPSTSGSQDLPGADGTASGSDGSIRRFLLRSAALLDYNMSACMIKARRSSF